MNHLFSTFKQKTDLKKKKNFHSSQRATVNHFHRKKPSAGLAVPPLMSFNALDRAADNPALIKVPLLQHLVPLTGATLAVAASGF